MEPSHRPRGARCFERLRLLVNGNRSSPGRGCVHSRKVPEQSLQTFVHVLPPLMYRTVTNIMLYIASSAAREVSNRSGE